MRAHTVWVLSGLSLFFVAGASLCALTAPLRAQTGELPRGGAARPLRLIASRDMPLSGSASEVAWGADGQSLLFTLESGGTRNIWRAVPDANDASRYPAWRATPLTELRAPRYAMQAAPVPNENALVCVSNVLSDERNATRTAQIVRYDVRRSTWAALSDGEREYESPVVAPDGKTVAFNSVQDEKNAIYLAAARNPKRRTLPEVRVLTSPARHAVWINKDWLLLESLAPRKRGLYRWPLQEGTPQLLVAGGGEAKLLGDNAVVFAAKTAVNAPTRLYLVARDGSGLRVLDDTAGARRPAPSPDGKLIAFDAPASNKPGAPRALWVLPLRDARPDAPVDQTPHLETRAHFLLKDKSDDPGAPVAQLSAAHAQEGGVAILGTLSGPADAVVALEVGQGGKPRRWETLKVPFPPASPLLADGTRVLALWDPPKGARGDWTLRLSISGMGSAAQSVLRVRLPLLPAPALVPAPVPPPVVSASVDAPKDITPHDVTLSPLPRATPLPAPLAPDVLPPIPPPGEELPAFPPAPVAPESQPAESESPPDVIAPAPIPPLPPDAPTPQPEPSAPIQAPDSAPFAAEFDVSGTPARMTPGEKVSVNFDGWNRGNATWQTGSSGANRVRIVARWVDFSTGTRRQWNYFWLSQPVAPGARATRAFDLPAPQRPGKYKLIYGLIRLPATGEYKPPHWSAAQETWDGEFAAIAFAVEVADPS